MDMLIDSSTRDYAGIRTTTLENAVYLRLETPLGSWWADKTVGSRLHELIREKDKQRVDKLAVQYAEQALKPLRDDGRASNITVTSSRPQAGCLMLQISVTDAHGNAEVFTHPVRVI